MFWANLQAQDINRVIKKVNAETGQEFYCEVRFLVYYPQMKAIPPLCSVWYGYIIIWCWDVYLWCGRDKYTAVTCIWPRVQPSIIKKRGHHG